MLFELNDKRTVRYRCHTGHAFSLCTLIYLQEEASDASLWTTPWVLQEKEAVLRRLVQAQEATMPEVARAALRTADTIADLRKAILGLTKSAHGLKGVD